MIHYLQHFTFMIREVWEEIASNELGRFSLIQPPTQDHKMCASANLNFHQWSWTNLWCQSYWWHVPFPKSKMFRQDSTVHTLPVPLLSSLLKSLPVPLLSDWMLNNLLTTIYYLSTTSFFPLKKLQSFYCFSPFDAIVPQF